MSSLCLHLVTLRSDVACSVHVYARVHTSIYIYIYGSVQLMFAIWRRAVAPVVRGAHNFLDWRGLAWLIEVRGLANRSEGLANRSEGLGAGLAGPCR